MGFPFPVFLGLGRPGAEQVSVTVSLISLWRTLFPRGSGKQAILSGEGSFFKTANNHKDSR